MGKTDQGSGWHWLTVLALEERGEYSTQPSDRLCPSSEPQNSGWWWPGEAAEFSKSLQKVWQQTEAELGLPSCSPGRQFPASEAGIWICWF